MANPVDVLTSLKKTNEDNYKFPSTLGSMDRGEDKFTFFIIKEILKGGDLKTIGTMALPMPTNLVDDYKVEYTDATLGPIGATAVGMGSQVANEFSMENLGNTLKNGLRAVNGNMLGQTVATKALEMVPGISTGDAKATAGQIVTSATNRAVNPYATGVFKSIGLKSFNFTFKLYPLNATDTNALKKIINFFKTSMLPEDEVMEMEAGWDADFTYEQKTGLQKLPHRFSISFKPGSDWRPKGMFQEYMFKVENAAMTSFSVDYESEAGPAFFKTTNAPLMATLNMTFTESKIHTRERDSLMYDELSGAEIG
jgi:hypothetical protein